MKILFFRKNEIQSKELEECMYNLQTIRTTLFNKL